jgi:hypothetical protein
MFLAALNGVLVSTAKADTFNHDMLRDLRCRVVDQARPPSLDLRLAAPMACLRCPFWNLVRGLLMLR